MRQLVSLSLGGLALLLLSAGNAFASNVEVKGAHICCAQCVKVVAKILSGVDGVSDVKSDVKTKTVTFTAKNAAAAKAGFKALTDGGFFGTATEDGKALKADVAPVTKSEKVNSITVKNVHVCCGLCQKAVKATFPDAKVGFEGDGAQRTVTIEGTGLERSAVIDALRKAGFNGTIEK